MLRRLFVSMAVAVSISGCTSRDVTKDLQVVDVRTGWYDLGIIKGENKLVPSISFKLKNVSSTPISGVQLNAVFRNLKENVNIGEHFAPGIASGDSLEPSATTRNIVLRSEFGYTSPLPRADMLKDARFIDRRVIVFGKHGRNNWTSMGEFPIARELLTE